MPDDWEFDNINPPPPVEPEPVEPAAIDTPVIDTPLIEIDAPVIDTPVIDTPLIEIDAPVIDTPVIDTPVIDTPVIDTPVIDTPLIEIDAPAIDTPSIDTPAIDTPSIDTPAIDTPVIDAPIDAPVIDAPLDTPAIDTPAIDAPIDAPVIDAPLDTLSIDTPAIDAPVIDAPAIELSASGEIISPQELSDNDAGPSGELGEEQEGMSDSSQIEGESIEHSRVAQSGESIHHFPDDVLDPLPQDQAPPNDTQSGESIHHFPDDVLDPLPQDQAPSNDTQNGESIHHFPDDVLDPLPQDQAPPNDTIAQSDNTTNWDDLTRWEKIRDPWNPKMSWIDKHIFHAQEIYARKMILDPENHPATGPLQGGVIVVAVGGLAQGIAEVAAALYGVGFLIQGGIEIALEGSIWSADDLLAGRTPKLTEHFLTPGVMLVGIRGLGLSAKGLKNMATSDGTLPSSILNRIDEVVEKADEQATNIIEAKRSDLREGIFSIHRPVDYPSGTAAEPGIEKAFHGAQEHSDIIDVGTQEVYLDRILQHGKNPVKGSGIPDVRVTTIDDEIMNVDFGDLKAYERVWSANQRRRRVGIRDLARKVAEQVTHRDNELPQTANSGDPNQFIIIDLRGREYSEQFALSIVEEIVAEIGRRTNNRIGPADIYPRFN